MRRIRPLGGLATGGVARRMGEARFDAEDARQVPHGVAGAEIATALRGIMEQLAEGLGKFAAVAATEAGREHAAQGGNGSRMVFGYSIRMGEGGLSAESFGNVPPKKHTASAHPAAAMRQPIVDIFEEADGYLVVAELPGVPLQDVACTVQGAMLHIRTAGPRPYAKEVELPGPANPQSLRVTCQHGILEVRLDHAGGTA